MTSQKVNAHQVTCFVYSHYRAGVAALFAAFPDEKRSVRLPEEQLLRLRPVQVPDEPALLIVVRQVLILLVHKVASAPTQLHNERCTVNKQERHVISSVLYIRRD